MAENVPSSSVSIPANTFSSVDLPVPFALDSAHHAARHINVGMSRVWTFTALVAEQIDQAETRRAQHLRRLCCVRDLHRRIDVACDGLAGLVFADARKETEFSRDAGGHTHTHSSGTAINPDLNCPLRRDNRDAFALDVSPHGSGRNRGSREKRV